MEKQPTSSSTEPRIDLCTSCGVIYTRKPVCWWCETNEIDWKKKHQEADRLWRKFNLAWDRGSFAYSMKIRELAFRKFDRMGLLFGKGDEELQCERDHYLRVLENL